MRLKISVCCLWVRTVAQQSLEVGVEEAPVEAGQCLILTRLSTRSQGVGKRFAEMWRVHRGRLVDEHRKDIQGGEIKGTLGSTFVINSTVKF